MKLVCPQCKKSRLVNRYIQAADIRIEYFIQDNIPVKGGMELYREGNLPLDVLMCSCGYHYTTNDINKVYQEMVEEIG